ncbi:MAG TPA: ArgE/DapE family deacylase [Candidatus Acidoferrales bacterium]|nr:ArgE/DapE family deacylase [Candidatus Acidoferrales bacterium]
MSRRENDEDGTEQGVATLSWLRQREDEIAALLSELVAIPTENPPGANYRACTDLLERCLRQAGLDCERLAPSVSGDDAVDVPESLLVTHGSGEPTLYFHGHYDVVPAQSREQFEPLRREHFLFGRGSCDMKGGIVAMFFAIRVLKEIGVELKGRIGLTLVPNEETGGEGGTAWLARQGLLGRDGMGMLLAEPTSGVVWNANRGAISLHVRVFGKPAHVGLQHQGENAFERMHAVVEKLQQLKSEVELRTTRLNIGSEQARNSILMLGGQSGGGANFNVVPEECWFTVDRRMNPEEDLAAEKIKLLGVLEHCKEDGIPLEWDILQEGTSASCNEDVPLGKALSHSVQAVTGQAPRFEMCPGLLETRFYAARGMPAYAYGPGLLSVAHGPNEYVDLRRVIDTAAIYALTAMELLKP